MFTKFPSLENSYQQKFIQNVGDHNPFPTQKWLAHEKIHGANFSFITDGKTVSCAKRSGPIKEGESFYNWRVVYEREKEAVIKFHRILCDVFQNDFDYIQIFGEICGGNSRGDMKSNYSQVQAGVFYDTDIIFIPFDVLINGNYFLNDCEQCLLDYQMILRYFTVAGFHHVQEKYLTFNTLNEALAISPVFTSKVYNGVIEGRNNAEGYVIRPVWDFRLPNGSRAIIKHKNPEFAEKKNTKPKTHFDSDKFLQENPEIKDKLEELLSYVNYARLQSVASKDGYTEMRHFGNLLKNTIADVFEDFNKDYPDWLVTQDDKVKKIFGKELATAVREEIKKTGILG